MKIGNVVVKTKAGQMLMVGDAELRAKPDGHLMVIELRNAPCPEILPARHRMKYDNKTRIAVMETVPVEFRVGFARIQADLRSSMDSGQHVRYYVTAPENVAVRVVSDPEAAAGPHDAELIAAKSAQSDTGGSSTRNRRGTQTP